MSRLTVPGSSTSVTSTVSASASPSLALTETWYRLSPAPEAMAESGVSLTSPAFSIVGRVL